MRNLLATTNGYIRLGFIIFLAVLLSMLLHEFGHFSMGSLLGNQMQMNLNSSRPVSGNFLESWHDPVVMSGGPLFTILQTVVVLGLILYFRKRWLYPLALVPGMLRIGLYTRFLFFPERLVYQDEAKLSHYFGWNPWAMPLIVCLVLLVLIWLGSRMLKAGWKYNVATIVTGFVIFVLLLKVNQAVFY